MTFDKVQIIVIQVNTHIMFNKLKVGNNVLLTLHALSPTPFQSEIVAVSKITNNEFYVNDSHIAYSVIDGSEIKKHCVHKPISSKISLIKKTYE